MKYHKHWLSADLAILSHSLRVVAWHVFVLCILSTRLVSGEPLLTEVHREERTDSVEKKLEQIRQANETGRFDLAMSLAESLKDTLGCEKQLQTNPTGPAMNLSQPSLVSELPAAWAQWARGWQHVQALKLTESAGAVS